MGGFSPAPVLSVPTMNRGAGAPGLASETWVSAAPHLPACTSQQLRELSRNFPFLRRTSYRIWRSFDDLDAAAAIDPVAAPAPGAEQRDQVQQEPDGDALVLVDPKQD